LLSPPAPIRRRTPPEAPPVTPTGGAHKTKPEEPMKLILIVYALIRTLMEIIWNGWEEAWRYENE